MAIRVDRGRGGSVLETGTGSIVADVDGQLTISTAAHVLARAKGAGVRIMVCPHKHVTWVPASRVNLITQGESPAPAATSADRLDDVAFLTIDKLNTEFTTEFLVEGVNLAPPSAVEPGTACWAYGYDPEARGMQWGAGRIVKVAGDEVEFDAARVKAGWSGGPVVVELGQVGMILRQASTHKTRLCVSGARVAAIAKEQAVPFSVRTDPVLDALVSAESLGRPLAMSWHEDQRWIALKLESHEGRSFRGTWVSYGPRSMDFRGGLGGEVHFQLRGAVLEAKLFESDGLGIPLTARTAELLMKAVAEPAIEGHIVLQAVDQQSMFLAVPRGDCELVAARQLLAAATAGRGLPSLGDDSLEFFTRSAGVAGGRHFPFMVSHFVTEWPTDLVSRKSFRVDEARAGEAFRLRGDVFPVRARRASKADAYWERTRVVLQDPVSESDLGRLPRPEPSLDSVPFDIYLEPLTRDFDFVLRGLSGRQGPGGYAFRGLVIDYRR